MIYPIRDQVTMEFCNIQLLSLAYPLEKLDGEMTSMQSEECHGWLVQVPSLLSDVVF